MAGQARAAHFRSQQLRQGSSKDKARGQMLKSPGSGPDAGAHRGEGWASHGYATAHDSALTG